MYYTKTAYPTLVFFVILTSAWLYSLVLGLQGEIPVWQSILFCSILAYYNFTPMHEICHRSVFFKRSKTIAFIEFVVGHISAATLFSPYDGFRILHFQHHGYTNVKGKDPDFWVATRNPIAVILKSLTIKLSYYYFMIIKPSQALKAKRVRIALTLSVYLFLIYLTPNPLLTFAIWFSSGIFALALVAFLFDWLPHTPHDEIDRYRTSFIVDKKWLIPIMLWQNYHLIHHLYPRIPFYKYHRKYLDVKDELVKKDARIS
jgi:beta-carotene hydroxylase